MKRVSLGIAAAATLGTFAAPSEAAIVCKDDYQYVAGHYISTPYCRDNYLARVARQYGSRVSDAAIRNNPNLKRDVCRLVGRDIRVRENCLEEGGGRGSR